MPLRNYIDADCDADEARKWTGSVHQAGVGRRKVYVPVPMFAEVPMSVEGYQPLVDLVSAGVEAVGLGLGLDSDLTEAMTLLQIVEICPS